MVEEDVRAIVEQVKKLLDFDNLPYTPENILLAAGELGYLHAAQPSAHPTLLESPQTYEAWLRSEFTRMGFEFKPQSG